MNIAVPLILQIIALVFVLLAGLSVPVRAPFQWGWLGMFFWFLSFMIGSFFLHSASAIH